MSAQKDINADIPVGDLQFYDNYVPALAAGNYFISVNQQLTNGNQVNEDPLTTMQEFVVAAPQFTIDPTQIMNKYPPAGSTGLYGEVLPHIVLKDPTLAWERALGASGTPWLALMVFTEEELTAGQNTTDKSSQIAINDFLNLKSPTLVTGVKKEDDIDGSSICRYINMPTSVFQAIAPTTDELPYLSHIRKINTGNRPIMGLNEHGLFSVIVSNRFAIAPASNGTPQPAKNIAHLVSLEGLDQYLTANADFSGYTSVSLVTLASWTFLSVPDIAQDFRALVSNLVQQEEVNQQVDATKLWLRLPLPSTSGGNGATEVTNRITNGFVPLAYHTRSGEDSFAWYRGPLTPLLPQSNLPTTPYASADAALIFDKTNGVFDVSLAAAWETGREAALADSDFIRKLLTFKKQSSRAADKLFYRAGSGHFANSDPESTVQENFLRLLTPDLVKQIGSIADSRVIAQQVPDTLKQSDLQAVHAFLEDSAVQQQLNNIMADATPPVADWLARFALLYPLPFDNLVPDERMLPVESIRFFYIDMNWINAGIDGALSLGIDSSKQSFFSKMTNSMVRDATLRTVSGVREKLLGRENADATPPAIMSGFLLRSALVTGWPNLAIRAKDSTDTSLKILRIDHLSPSVLLCIFDGVPDNIELSEPQETLGFGVDDDGMAVLRNILTDGEIGNQLGTVKIRDSSGQQQLCMRSAASNVLHIAPSDSSGLIQTLTNALTRLNNAPPGGKLTAATFSIQMIKSAEAIVFNSQTT